MDNLTAILSLVNFPFLLENLDKYNKMLVRGRPHATDGNLGGRLNASNQDKQKTKTRNAGIGTVECELVVCGGMEEAGLLEKAAAVCLGENAGIADVDHIEQGGCFRVKRKTKKIKNE
jgi:hypothetical protein